jgi:hypothetical protein
MRWLKILAATTTAALGEGGNFSGTAFDAQSGRTQVISGTLERQEPTGHEKLMSTYDDIIRSSQESVANMRAQSAQWELESQTRELEAQTNLLREMSEKVVSQASTPPTVIVNTPVESTASAPIYSVAAAVETVEPSVERGSGLDTAYILWLLAESKRQSEESATIIPIEIAKSGRSFGRRGRLPTGERMVVSDFHSSDKNSNEQLIKAAIQYYKGSVTNYRWRGQRVDEQTFLVICEVSLDGRMHDFRFEVNPKLETCMYVGGTGFDKLKPTASLSLWPW